MIKFFMSTLAALAVITSTAVALMIDSLTWEGLKLGALIMAVCIGFLYVYIRIYWQEEEEWEV